MNIRALSWVALAAFGVPASAQLSSIGHSGGPTAPEFVANEVLVKFRAGREAIGRLVSTSFGGQVVEELADLKVHRIQLAEGTGVMEAVAFLGSRPEVEFAEPNYIARASLTPNDTYYAGYQWNMPKIQANLAWDYTQGSSNVVIAIIDTGVQSNHPDLSGKVTAGYNYVSNNTNANDDNGHGTHCAGIAAAKTNNATGVAGVGFNCRIMPVKVLNSQGSGSFSAIANGINFARTNGAKVLSLSLGGTSGSSTLSTAITNAWNSGCVIVAAAGNSGNTTPNYPAYYSSCIAVGSTTSTDTRSSFSNYGASWVDVAAPGSSIASTYRNSQYVIMSGTSMSTPHVAGLAGLLYSYLGTGTSNSTIRSRIENNCDNVGTWVAKGRINCRRAITNGP
ncbi:MAG: Thermophilic serine proteinase [Fimbriimonadaceae bacterium]|nr:Thermophilic serine proteinase [Fimbriimonadaceae bacterium]